MPVTGFLTCTIVTRSSLTNSLTSISFLLFFKNEERVNRAGFVNTLQFPQFQRQLRIVGLAQRRMQIEVAAVITALAAACNTQVMWFLASQFDFGNLLRFELDRRQP